LSKTRPSDSPCGNRLLSHLPKADYELLLPHLTMVTLTFRQVLYESGMPIVYAYFPCRGVASALSVMEDGTAIEVATIGNEGMLGMAAVLGLESSSDKVIIQVAGNGLRIDSLVLKATASPKSTLRRVLLLYFTVFLKQVSQAVACNGLHQVQARCCRWLLMTQDRVQSDELPLTHEFLAIMLGVRRASVTEVLRPLQASGLIRSIRGRIIVLDRAGVEAASCECYRTVQHEFERLLHS
jgi:CRP-like cAMP-binding protein